MVWCLAVDNSRVDSPDSQDGIEIAVQIRDLRDRKRNDCPKYYTHRTHMTERQLTSMTTNALVTQTVKLAASNVICEWLDERSMEDNE